MADGPAGAAGTGGVGATGEDEELHEASRATAVTSTHLSNKNRSDPARVERITLARYIVCRLGRRLKNNAFCAELVPPRTIDQLRRI